jgi:hypothetical protein
MAANAGASSLGGTGRVIQVRIQNSVAGLRGAVIVVRSRHQITVATAIESNAKLLIFLKCVLLAQGGEVGLKTGDALDEVQQRIRVPLLRRRSMPLLSQSLVLLPQILRHFRLIAHHFSFSNAVAMRHKAM